MLPSDQLSQLVHEHLSAGETFSPKWIIADSPLGGRGLFAIEDISSGETLFVDSPLVQGPRSRSNQQRSCTVCCKVTGINFINCTNCALILCSKDCKNSDVHKNDCETISRWNTKLPLEEIDDAQLCRALTPIRALTLNEKQKEFVRCLQAHGSPQHGDEVRKLIKYFDIPEEEEKFMTLVCYVLDATAFQIASPYGREESSKRGLYPVAGLMNHNCVANTRHSFDTKFRMTVQAVKPIRAGTEILTCYTGALWGTPARRHHLYKTKQFFCKCERCADPTERGTLLAALRCLSTECPGSLLPIEPLKTATPWRCLNCSLVVPANSIGAIQSALGSLMGSLDFENVSQLENFLINRVTKYIPRTNQIVADLQCRLIWLLGETEGLRWHELSEQRLSLKEKLCRGTLRVAAALGLGDAHLRGLLLYHLHAALAERARRYPSIYEELKSEIESTIEQAYHILEGDISAPPDLEMRRRYLGPGSEKTHQERFFILEC